MSGGMGRAAGWLKRYALNIGICLALAVVGILVLTSFGRRLGGAGPYMLLLACPLTHLFMNHGHGGHGGHGSPSDGGPIQGDEHRHHR